MHFNPPKISTKQSKIQFVVLAILAFFMVLTRGGHALTSVSLPDASLVLFLIGGIYLRQVAWFIGFFILAALIDFGSAALNPAQAFCLTNGYWGLIPSYGVMWLAGRWLHGQKNALAFMPFMLTVAGASLMAFIFSTQTYYLYSGRFPSASLWESLQHGWTYLPAWMAYSLVYALAFLASVHSFRKLREMQDSRSAA